jgi:hypothetical protein
MTMTRSIYAAPLQSSICRDPSARFAQQARAQVRLTQALGRGPDRNLNRQAPITQALWAYRTQDIEPGDPQSPIQQLLIHTQNEVETLEAWVQTLPSQETTRGAAVRQALDFLRTFGRLSTLNFGVVPQEDRASLVRWLALEHRGCYAAAGTSRRAFKLASGRSGAR